MLEPPTRFAEFSIPASMKAPSQAREHIGELTAGWLTPTRLYDAQLVVTELVVNAMLHGGATETVEITARLDRNRLWVGIAQPGPFPGVRSVDDGWGLQILARIADEWGVERTTPTVVWFVLNRSAPPP